MTIVRVEGILLMSLWPETIVLVEGLVGLCSSKQLINRPGVAGAVLQIPSSMIISFIC